MYFFIFLAWMIICLPDRRTEIKCHLISITVNGGKILLRVEDKNLENKG